MPCGFPHKGYGCSLRSVIFFFLKQKAAYEMLSGDWSSDVCSSDLFGKIYRTTPLDGTRSLWFFRSTRPFDTASGFDTPDRSVFSLNFIATFKFQDLQLVSNPTIAISESGITKLALIGVGGIF